jgi:hypothetical protein
MTYELLEAYSGMELGLGNRPQPHGFRYRAHDLRPQTMPNLKVAR